MGVSVLVFSQIRNRIWPQGQVKRETYGGSTKEQKLIVTGLEEGGADDHGNSEPEDLYQRRS